VATKLSLIWRLRLALHGVRLSPFARRDLAVVRGVGTRGAGTRSEGTRESEVAYRVTMVAGDLIGAETAPVEARVNIRAASFVLRHFGVRVADIRSDAEGALLSINPDRVGLATTKPKPKAKAAGRSVA
jgi:hypothetical protein